MAVMLGVVNAAKGVIMGGVEVWLVGVAVIFGIISVLAMTR